MRMRKAVFLVVFLASAGAARADNDVCVDPQTGMVNQQATEGWQQFQAAANPQAMQQLAGVWYTEIRSPSTGQIDYHYNMFEPNGLYQYTSKVCSSDGLCSDYQGQGFWAAQMDNSGTLVTMTIVSDLSRTNLCGLSYARFVGQGMLQDTNNLSWRKVQ
jgi:hypothetical protein